MEKKKWYPNLEDPISLLDKNKKLESKCRISLNCSIANTKT